MTKHTHYKYCRLCNPDPVATPAPAPVPPPTPVPAPIPTSSGIDVVATLRDLQIKSGSYKNGFEIAPNGRLNWYFTNLGLINAIRSNCLTTTDVTELVLPYLDLYLASVKPNYTIDDVNFLQGRANPRNFTHVPSDSDDSYASTFLALVFETCYSLGNYTFYQLNKAKIHAIANANLVNNRKPNGLTSTFQQPRRANYDVAFLEDNCESYDGLTGLRYLSGSLEFNEAIDSITAGIRSLFKQDQQAFVYSDITPSVGTTFYPDAVSQVFPQFYYIPGINDLFTPAYSFFQFLAPDWETGSYDAYPWALLGVVAARNGNTAKAKAQLLTIEALFKSNRSLVTINELGFYAYTKSLIK